MQLVHNILIVESSILMGERLKQIVTSMGHDVAEICTCLGCTNEIIEQTQPTLVLLDIRINKANEGLKVAQMLQKKKVPFVFSTVFENQKLQEEINKLRPHGYISKPFGKQEVEQTIALLTA